MNHARGFALITVLLFLQVFAVLSLYALQTEILKNKMTGQFWHKHLEQISAEALLVQLEHNMQSDSQPCVIPVTSAVTFIHQTLDWWESVSCSGNFNSFQYYYVIERLGADSCSDIEQEDIGSANKTDINALRLTLLMVNHNNVTEKVMLQTVLLLEPKDDGVGHGNASLAKAGRQSWRELV
jgi:hypothetical protein